MRRQRGMVVRVRGVKKATSKGHTYYYHRKTGKRIKAQPGTAAFVAEVAQLDGENPGLERKVKGSVGALIADYRDSHDFVRLAPRTRADYQSVFDYLLELELDPFPLMALNAAGVVKLRDRAMNDRKRRFANHLLQVLCTVLNWGVARDYVERNPAAGLRKIPRPRDMAPANRPWKDQECTAVIEAASPGLRAGIGLGMFAGARIGDVQWMTWSVYDGQRLRWRQGKTGEEVDLPVDWRLRAILEAAPRGTATTIATGRGGIPYTPPGLAKAFRTLIKRLENVGAVEPGLTFHGLRHTAATRLADLGCDPRTIAAMLGHKSLAAAIHYSNAADKRRRGDAAVAALERGANAELENRVEVFQKRGTDGC